jgi:5'-methylthioadenosine phosphorylase
LSAKPTAEVGILGGSGLYSLSGLVDARRVTIDTPFGAPSDALWVGTIAGRRVAFLARHGRDHLLLPGEINYRANIFALKTLGIERVLSASAVGSMRDHIHPRDVVVPRQFIDRTRNRPSTFFGNGIAAHVSFGDPVCPELSAAVASSARRAGARVHDGGTYLCIEGPQFSTRAESMLYRGWNVDVIGMTNLQEAKLSREAEMCYATLALVTDYDCWHEEQAEVTVETLIDNLRANGALAVTVLEGVVQSLPRSREACGCGHALRHAVITPRSAISAETRERLGPILERYLD